MATTKKSGSKPAKTAAKPKTRTITPQTASRSMKTSEAVTVENFAALSSVIETLGVTLEMLVRKMEGMASHVIATEEIIAELVAAQGLNLARVNARIRARVSAGTDSQGDANQAIDAAALITSPLPNR